MQSKITSCCSQNEHEVEKDSAASDTELGSILATQATPRSRCPDGQGPQPTPGRKTTQHQAGRREQNWTALALITGINWTVCVNGLK